MVNSTTRGKRVTGRRAEKLEQDTVTSNEVAKAWSKGSPALAQWAQDHLVNRDDVHGQYLSVKDRTDKKKARTVHEGITLEQLRRHFKGEDVGDLCGLHAISPKNKSGWLVIDIDCHSDDKELKKQNDVAVMALYSKAKSGGLKPLLIGSNGRGGYHLWVLFKMLLPTSKVYDLGQWLVADWDKLGLCEKPEVFPKQRKLADKTKFGNWIRLPGRHHTRDYWSKVWDGKQWLVGKEAIEAIVKTTGVRTQVVSDIICKATVATNCSGAEVKDHEGSRFLTGDADLDQFAPLLRNVKKSRNCYTASCPCPDHPDEHPSFSFRKSAGGRIQFICYRGCTIDNINDAINKLRIANGAGNGTDVVSLMTELDREKFNKTLRKLNIQLTKALTPKLLNELSDTLSVPVDALHAFDAGWSEQNKCWSFPMRDASGTIIGIAYRRRKGGKFVHPGSVSGLFLAKGWKDLKGTIFVPEGVSDAAAMLAMDIPVIGRFNNSHGDAMLAEVCKQLKCEVVILGDNDCKRDGSWPGLKAKEVADKLTRLLGRNVMWGLPPEGFKDVRSWLINQGVKR